ncbi:glycosyltransferase family 4 protein [Paenibacillus sp. RC67]|uniref:glycosyltransferase family 4 protein n=1 Tax=Paenibacillus sp. RC67 TaxID=3039392 RepID=UPI0024AD255E|nr:glycosyltransferase family 4 protein [Paenibacillus sp. RC67]
MKILIVCSWGLPHVGGVSTYVDQLRKGLEREGHHVDLFCPTPDAQSYYVPSQSFVLEKNKIAPIISERANLFFDQHLPGLDPWIRTSEIDRYCLEIAAASWGLKQYDIIHAQDIISAHAISRVRPPGVALVTTMHGCLAMEWFVKLKEMGIPEQDRSSLLWHYSASREYIGATSSEVTITPSNWLKQLLIKDFQVPAHHLMVAPYGIDVDHLKQTVQNSSNITKPLGKKVILCSARFDVVKGHVHLLHALGKLAAERKDWVCWLAGDGALANEFKQLSQSLGLDQQVVFLGNRADVPALLKMADLFVLPSLQDNQPFAVMEAQIAGKPVLVSDAGGIPEMVADRLTGLISEAGNHEQLYQHLKMTLDDPGLCNRLGYHAQVWASKYWSLSAMTERNIRIYKRAIQINSQRSESKNVRTAGMGGD